MADRNWNDAAAKANARQPGEDSGVSENGSTKGKNRYLKVTIHPLPEQPPKVTSALRYMLRRYADDLRPFAESTGNKMAARMIDACEFLVIEGERL